MTTNSYRTYTPSSREEKVRIWRDDKWYVVTKKDGRITSWEPEDTAENQEEPVKLSDVAFLEYKKTLAHEEVVEFEEMIAAEERKLAGQAVTKANAKKQQATKKNPKKKGGDARVPPQKKAPRGKKKTPARKRRRSPVDIVTLEKPTPEPKPNGESVGEPWWFSKLKGLAQSDAGKLLGESIVNSVRASRERRAQEKKK